jgi:hypothetical protein
MTARILAVTPAEYHRLPGFSATLAKLLIRQCAAKAWDAHQRKLEAIAAEDESDGEEEVSDEKRKQLDNGSIKHALVLGRGAERIKVIPKELLSKNGAYGTDASKAARDAARAAGLIPVKEPEMEVHERVAIAIRARIADAGHLLDGTSELAIAWTERTPHGDVDCRAMLDHVVMWGAIPGNLEGSGAPGATIYDLKIVGDAHPDRCERTAENLGYAIQACAYRRALAALHPRLAGRINFQFLFCEGKRPYAMWAPPMLSGAFRELGERRWLRAVHAWAEGLETGRWPDYQTPDRVELTAPMWTLRQEGFTPEEM